MNNHVYTDEEKHFLESICPDRTLREVQLLYNSTFGMPITLKQLKSFYNYRKIQYKKAVRIFTEEEKNFLKKEVRGKSFKQILALFNASFTPPIKEQQLVNFIHRFHLKTGRTGQFEKGHRPYNEGTKGVHKGGEATRFKEGNKTWNTRPIGAEGRSSQGYVYIKVGQPNVWRPKHIVIWEQANGPVPEGHMVMFADGNKSNVVLDNLILVSRREFGFMLKKGLIVGDASLTKTGKLVAEVIISAKDRESNIKK